jgi:hypothetical protein
VKVISLWQPWASAIAVGAKGVETLGVHMGDNKPLWDVLPFGAIVAVCNLVDCRPTGSFTQQELDTKRFQPGETGDLDSWTERMMGNFDLGRFGWVLKDVKPLPQPIPFKGKQGFFEVPDALIAEAFKAAA